MFRCAKMFYPVILSGTLIPASRDKRKSKDPEGVSFDI